MIENILLILVVMTLNVLDSVTTSLCFKQYPDKEYKGESNPFMRYLMLRNKKLAEILKQVFVLGVTLYFILIEKDIVVVRYIGIMLGLVVLNNTSVVLSRDIFKRKITSPFEKLRQILHIPEKFMFYVSVFIIAFMAYWIHVLIWG